MLDKRDLESAQKPASISRHRPTALTLILTAALAFQLLKGTEWSSLPRTVLPVRSQTAPLAPFAPGLSWSACPDITETFCSYLTVPMDYTNPKSEETVSLALRMLPATVPASEQLGYLFTNPGGPGGSGHAFVGRRGGQLSKIVQGRYHIVSWDPRAVNLTSPALSCFPTSGDSARFDRDIQHLGLLPRTVAKATDRTRRDEADASSHDESKPDAAGRAWVAQVDGFSRTLGEACVTSDDQSKAMLRSSTTAFVVRDIVRIMDALGESALNYWGFSYGTILGATFAAMFPEKVGRLWLDGVSDSQSYTNNLLDWGRAGMNDTHKTYEGFLSSCAESGPEGCALAHSESTAKELGRRIQMMMDELDKSPLAVGRSAVGPGIITSASVQYAIFRSLYVPKSWPDLASALSLVAQKNGTALLEMLESSNNELGRQMDVTDNVFHRRMQSGSDSTAAIMCSDTDQSVLNNTSISTFHSYIRELAAISPTGSHWAMWIGACRHFKAAEEPREVYRGPWTRKEGLKKTAYPIVFFSQTADPVTPLISAQKMADGFGADSARLLVQDGYGHCSAAHPSLCTALSIRAYFTNGTLPEVGKVCKSDPGFLFPQTGAANIEGGEYAELKKAMRELSEFEPSRMGMRW